MSWTGIDGSLIPYPHELLEALKSLPGAERISVDEMDVLARLIEEADAGGRDDELPRNLPASETASDRELVALHDLCLKLVDHIEAMHKPAVAALHREGVASLTDLAQSLRETAEYARHAYGDTRAPERASGRRPALKAAAVTDMAATVFEKITGKTATYTSDWDSSEMRGHWPEFLTRVFAALYIDASPESQVKLHRAKSTPPGKNTPEKT